MIRIPIIFNKTARSERVYEAIRRGKDIQKQHAFGI